MSRTLHSRFSSMLRTLKTSKGSRDAWAIGYTKDYIVGLWLGDFAGSEMINITGQPGKSESYTPAGFLANLLIFCQ